jgi:hypothetical protein
MNAADERRRAHRKLGDQGYWVVSRICGEGYSLNEVARPGSSKRAKLAAANDLRAHLDTLAAMWNLATRRQQRLPPGRADSANPGLAGEDSAARKRPRKAAFASAYPAFWKYRVPAVRWRTPPPWGRTVGVAAPMFAAHRPCTLAFSEDARS